MMLTIFTNSIAVFMLYCLFWRGPARCVSFNNHMDVKTNAVIYDVLYKRTILTFHISESPPCSSEQSH